MQKVEEMRRLALDLMAEKGFPILEDVQIAVDEKLPFMGYTTEKNGQTVIVVAGWSLQSDMSMGLIIHELSHVYRIETGHPSHNTALHNKVLHEVLGEKRVFQYQHEALHNIINNLQDLYADDISFEVLIKDLKQQDLNEFFLGWIHEPVVAVKTEKDRWKNAEFLLSAAFAKANLERHEVVDTGGKVEKAVHVFLEGLDTRITKKFDYFEALMVHMPEKITDEDFTKFLHGYLSTFLSLTKHPAA